jgi:hypothetical protein
MTWILCLLLDSVLALVLGPVVTWYMVRTYRHVRPEVPSWRAMLHAVGLAARPPGFKLSRQARRQAERRMLKGQ